MQDEDALWMSFRLTRDTETRKQLTKLYLPLVKHIASAMKRRIKANRYCFGDLVAEGVIGLMDAIEKFDVTTGNKFKTFAPWRIRGAMLDSVREDDWVPKKVRAHCTKLASAVNGLELSLNRKPNYNDISTYLGITVSELKRWLSEIPPTIVEMSALEGRYEDSKSNDAVGDHGSRMDLSFMRSGVSHVDEVANRDYKDVLLANFSDRDKTIVNMLAEKYSQREISKTLDLSEGYISQLVEPLTALLHINMRMLK